jgi:serine/threonine-protein kinase
VRQDGVPKLLDFGIAKLLNPELAGQVDPTRADLLLLTPNYASPEQIQGRPVTTASDVYSLGVLLYRLLTDAYPRPIAAGASVREIVQAVWESEPLPPSRAVPRERARPLKGDLDAILLKALAHAPDQRYPTAAALAEELRRFQGGEPVSVRCNSRGYRLERFLRRHRWRVAAAVGLLAILLGLLAHTLVQSGRTAEALAEARRQHDRAEALNDFLIHTLVEADPYQTASARRELTMVQALIAAETTVEETLGDQPELSVAVRNLLGNALDVLGEYAVAERSLKAALELQLPGVAAAEELPPVETLPSSLDLAETLNHLGLLAHHQGQEEAAERWLRTSVGLMERRELGDEHPHPKAVYNQNLALVLRARGAFEEAETRLLEARAVLLALPTRDAARDAAFVLSNLATLHNARGDYAASVDLLRQAIEEGRRLHGSRGKHPILVGDALHNLGYTLYVLGRYDEAEAALEEALQIRRAVLGDAHPMLADTYNVRGAVARAEGKYADAAAAFRASLELVRAALGPGHPRLVVDLHQLGLALCLEGAIEEAAPYLEEARQILEAAENPRVSHVASNRSVRARWHMLRGEWETAEGLAREALELRRELLGNEHRAVALSRIQLGEIACRRGDHGRALEAFETALGILSAAVGEESSETLQARLGQGRCLTTLGRHDEAEERLALVLYDPPPVLTQHQPLRRDFLNALVELYEAAGKSSDAERVRTALEALVGPAG